MPSERELQAIWYEGKKPSILLRVLSVVYGTVALTRRALYRTGILPRHRLAVPVIVVGNITAGGTGKTPLVIAIVEALRERGFKPGVISRGYAGSASDCTIVGKRSDPLVVGDEARLIFDRTGVPIVVGRDRVAAGRLLLKSSGVDVIVTDDGLQHYRLRRDIEICVIDSERRFGNGKLLPAGPLREPLSRLDSVTFRICNGGAEQDREVPMQLVADQAVSLVDSAQRPLASFSEFRIHAVAGIGNPSRFFAELRNGGLNVIEHPFADHHAFVAHDLEFGDDAPILMTEKDAVKCVAFAKSDAWSVPVRAHLPSSFFDAMIANLTRR
jgi:tetraacyldisaccharide 4'-kinase